MTFSLLGLLALTVAASFVQLGAFASVVAVGIAEAKAALIVLFFMHVRYGSAMTKLSAAGFFWLLLLFLLTFSDYVTRG